MPFNDTTIVFNIAGKIFALASLNINPLRTNLKCDHEKAVELRELYAYVRPGYHMNKTHWNTIEISRNLRIKLIDHSCDLVKAKLTKSRNKSIYCNTIARHLSEYL